MICKDLKADLLLGKKRALFWGISGTLRTHMTFSGTSSGHNIRGVIANSLLKINKVQ